MICVPGWAGLHRFHGWRGSASSPTRPSWPRMRRHAVLLEFLTHGYGKTRRDRATRLWRGLPDQDTIGRGRRRASKIRGGRIFRDTPTDIETLCASGARIPACATGSAETVIMEQKPRRVGRGGPIPLLARGWRFSTSRSSRTTTPPKIQVVVTSPTWPRHPEGCPPGSAIDPAQRDGLHMKTRRALPSHDPVFLDPAGLQLLPQVSRSATEEASLRRPDDASIAERTAMLRLQSPPSRRQHQGLWDPPDLEPATRYWERGCWAPRTAFRLTPSETGPAIATEKLVARVPSFPSSPSSAAGRRCGDVRARVVPELDTLGWKSFFAFWMLRRRRGRFLAAPGVSVEWLPDVDRLQVERTPATCRGS